MFAVHRLPELSGVAESVVPVDPLLNPVCATPNHLPRVVLYSLTVWNASLAIQMLLLPSTLILYGSPRPPPLFPVPVILWSIQYVMVCFPLRPVVTVRRTSSRCSVPGFPLPVMVLVANQALLEESIARP